MYSPEYLSTVALIVSLMGFGLGVRNEFILRRRQFLERKRELILAVTKLRIRWQESNNLLYHFKQRVHEKGNSSQITEYLDKVDKFLSEALNDIKPMEILTDEIRYGKVGEAVIYDATSKVIRMELNIGSYNEEMIKKFDLIESKISM